MRVAKQRVLKNTFHISEINELQYKILFYIDGVYLGLITIYQLLRKLVTVINYHIIE